MQHLALKYHQVAESMRLQMLPIHYPAAEQHFTAALRLWRALERPPVNWELLEGPSIFDPAAAIESRIGLGKLYCQWARYSDATHVLNEALMQVKCVRHWTPDRRLLDTRLAEIFTCCGRVQMEQHANSEKVSEALISFESALEIHRNLSSQESARNPKHLVSFVMPQTRTSDVLFDMVDALCLACRFEEAKSAVQEVLDIRTQIFGNESIAAAVCHCRLAIVLGRQAHKQLTDMQRGRVKTHLEHWHNDSTKMRVQRFLSSSRYAYPRVRDERIYCQTEVGKKDFTHEYFESVTMRTERGNIQSREQPSDSLSINLFTADVQDRVPLPTIKYLKEKQLDCCKKALGVYLKVFGVTSEIADHDFHILGQVLADTFGNGQADHSMCRKLKMHRRVWGGDDPRIQQFVDNLRRTELAMARSDKPGVLVETMDTPPLSRCDDDKNLARSSHLLQTLTARLTLPSLRCTILKKQDEKAMLETLAALDILDDSNMTSYRMQMQLRRCGLQFQGTASDPVSRSACVSPTMPCLRGTMTSLKGGNGGLLEVISKPEVGRTDVRYFRI